MMKWTDLLSNLLCYFYKEKYVIDVMTNALPNTNMVIKNNKGKVIYNSKSSK